MVVTREFNMKSHDTFKWSRSYGKLPQAPSRGITFDWPSERSTIETCVKIDRPRRQLYWSSIEYLDPDALAGMRLRNPVIQTTVQFSPEDDQWIATDNASLEYGLGDTPRKAIESFIENLHDMAAWFSDNDRPLGRMMEQRLAVFRRMFRDL